MEEQTLPQRKSPRKRGYDYSLEGAYFVNICTFQREYLFGHICDGEMHRNTTGDIVATCRSAIPNHYPQVELDAYVVMPNHFHGIITLTDAVGAPYMVSADNKTQYDTKKAIQPHKTPSLGVVIGTFKAAVARHINKVMKFPPTVWQARYHDRIICNEHEYNVIRAYVLNNPARWGEDMFNSSYS